MKVLRMLKLGDILLMTGLAMAALILILSMRGGNNDARAIEIVYVKTGQVQAYPLNQDATYTISSESFQLTLTVCHGEASVSESTCDNQVCVGSPSISRTGQSIVCAPARVIIRVIGKEVDLDAISG